MERRRLCRLYLQDVKLALADPSAEPLVIGGTHHQAKALRTKGRLSGRADRGKIPKAHNSVNRVDFVQMTQKRGLHIFRAARVVIAGLRVFAQKSLDFVQIGVVEAEFCRADDAFNLLGVASADDRARDGGVAQRPRDRYLAG